MNSSMREHAYKVLPARGELPGRNTRGSSVSFDHLSVLNSPLSAALRMQINVVEWLVVPQGPSQTPSLPICPLMVISPLTVPYAAQPSSQAAAFPEEHAAVPPAVVQVSNVLVVFVRVQRFLRHREQPQRRRLLVSRMPVL